MAITHEGSTEPPCSEMLCLQRLVAREQTAEERLLSSCLACRLS